MSPVSIENYSTIQEPVSEATTSTPAAEDKDIEPEQNFSLIDYNTHFPLLKYVRNHLIEDESSERSSPGNINFRSLIENQLLVNQLVARIMSSQKNTTGDNNFVSGFFPEQNPQEFGSGRQFHEYRNPYTFGAVAENNAASLYSPQWNNGNCVPYGRNYWAPDVVPEAKPALWTPYQDSRPANNYANQGVYSHNFAANYQPSYYENQNAVNFARHQMSYAQNNYQPEAATTSYPPAQYNPHGMQYGEYNSASGQNYHFQNNSVNQYGSTVYENKAKDPQCSQNSEISHGQNYNYSQFPPYLTNLPAVPQVFAYNPVIGQNQLCNSNAPPQNCTVVRPFATPQKNGSNIEQQTSSSSESTSSDSTSEESGKSTSTAVPNNNSSFPTPSQKRPYENGDTSPIPTHFEGKNVSPRTKKICTSRRNAVINNISLTFNGTEDAPIPLSEAGRYLRELTQRRASATVTSGTSGALNLSQSRPNSPQSSHDYTWYSINGPSPQKNPSQTQNNRNSDTEFGSKF